MGGGDGDRESAPKKHNDVGRGVQTVVVKATKTKPTTAPSPRVQRLDDQSPIQGMVGMETADPRWALPGKLFNE